MAVRPGRTLGVRHSLVAALGLCLTSLLLTACASLDRRIVEPPRPSPRFLSQAETLLQRYELSAETYTSRHGQQLSHVRVEPRDYQLDYTVLRHERSFSYRLRPGEPEQLGPIQPARGTVILLHGWSTSGLHLLPWALRMAELGLRSVLLDLRGHGASEPAPLGFGIREVDDVLDLLDHLDRNGQLQPPVYLIGVSYGAATALHTGHRAADRIAAIVAFAPYANAADGIASGIAGLIEHGTSSRLRERMIRRAFRLRYDTDRVQAAIDRASARLDLDLRAIDVAAELAATPQCVLLLHGDIDTLIPVETARSLAQSNPRSVYVELPDEGHFSISARADWLAEPIADWLAVAATTGSDQPCPTLPLPPDPAPDTWPD